MMRAPWAYRCLTCSDPEGHWVVYCEYVESLPLLARPHHVNEDDRASSLYLQDMDSKSAGFVFVRAVEEV